MVNKMICGKPSEINKCSSKDLCKISHESSFNGKIVVGVTEDIELCLSEDTEFDDLMKRVETISTTFSMDSFDSNASFDVDLSAGSSDSDANTSIESLFSINNVSFTDSDIVSASDSEDISIDMSTDEQTESTIQQVETNSICTVQSKNDLLGSNVNTEQQSKY